MAIYVCSICLFKFERAGPVENCPVCARINVREADPQEIEEYISDRNGTGSKSTQKSKGSSNEET